MFRFLTINLPLLIAFLTLAQPLTAQQPALSPPAQVSPGISSGAPTAAGAPRPAISGKYDSWTANANAHYMANQNNQGLAATLRALDLVQELDYDDYDRTYVIVDIGWSGDTQPAMKALQQNAPALEAAVAASAAESIAFPYQVDFKTDKYPEHIDKIDTIVLLILAEARRQEAAGAIQAAGARIFQAMAFSRLFLADGFSMDEHEAGIAGVQMSLHVLQSVLRRPDIAPGDIQKAGAALYEFDKKMPGFENSLLTQLNIDLVAQKDRLDDVDKSDKRKHNMGSKFIQFGTGIDMSIPESKEVEEAMHKYLEVRKKPAWKSERGSFRIFTFNDDDIKKKKNHPISNNSYIKALVTRWVSYELDHDSIVAEVRMTAAMCALRMGQPALVSNFIDPFTGNPLRNDDTKIWSAGPDGRDDGGRGEPQSLEDLINADGAWDLVLNWK